MLCCQEWKSWVTPAESPLRRILAFGYYDGATEGIAACSVCGAAYAFRLMDWDDGQDLRVFSVARLPVSLDEVAVRVRTTPPPDSGVAVAGPIVGESDEYLSELLSSTPQFVVATYDLCDRIDAVRAAPETRVNDWIVWMRDRDQT